MLKTLLIILALLALLIVAFFVRIYWQNAQVPALGHTQGQLTPLSSKPNGVSSQTSDADKKVEPWPFIDDQSSSMQAIMAAVQSYGEADVVTQEPNYLRVVFVTPRMRFRDDAEFYLDADTKLVHFRSASRAGHSDMGLNRKRHQALTRLYLEQQN
ncbi:DUF1499 domain-containing protein [Halopseudomonas salegens]|uniref:Uncharacterized conserved protein, DUF1499 family n=1 Tax=Halopseudomonas salegens TaxID=1434072 RepID=A0A1H2FST3_9GAMM|nr:DUF1499 domain-containing protein [Halopseudomonas salegens]SDU10413.1 Uncharacterized conserved protein, DUF1499 family [Halopseudomonas salegens]